ncbi:hypothetical protein Q9L58_006342 [Maublancomyces gigas]|uniref:ER lumen protein-retaining receptor n=1 Tax=Discina gigas TaxID=1032678 RepID=A0ABR3GFK0_9PEZI
MNVFRLTGDLLHLFSKLILIFTIHSRRSAEGISLLAQSLYALVFLARYVDLLTVPWGYYIYNTIFKLFYIASSFYILFLMLRVYARTREEEREWKVSAIILGGSVVSAPIFQMILGRGGLSQFTEVLWTFSIILESLAILPQLSLLRHTQIPTAITSYYLLALGLYRALYIPNWIFRYFDPEDGFYDPVAIIFGILQTALYIDFAWVYYRRQRVKIRENGAVLDGDDFVSGGLLLGWVFGGKKGGAAGRRTGGGWRGTGMSISADEALARADSPSEDELGDELEDEESEDDLEVEGLGGDRDVERGLIGK